MAARLKAVESQALGMQKSSKVVEALEGVSAGASYTFFGEFHPDTAKGRIIAK